MECRVGTVAIHYVEHGNGPVVLGLHGAGVDHREIEAALEAVLPRGSWRRVYPDLPGMGASTADGLTSNDDVVDVLVRFIEQFGESVVLIGHSYGAYLARGVAARRPDLIRALGLICPIGVSTTDTPESRVVQQDADAYDDLDEPLRQGFDDYVVVRTADTARRYRDSVAPGTRLVDEAALGRIFGTWPIDVAGPFPGPTAIIAGRDDSTAGYRDAMALLEDYPHASLMIVDGAGHALPHERPEIVGAVLADLRERAS